MIYYQHNIISTILKPSGGTNVSRGRSHINSTNFSVGTGILSRVRIGTTIVVTVTMVTYVGVMLTVI